MSTKCYTRDRVKGVLRAFVMRARLISRPHYLRLRIIAIHCDFSSESYIHIDPLHQIKLCICIMIIVFILNLDFVTLTLRALWMVTLFTLKNTTLHLLAVGETARQYPSILTTNSAKLLLKGSPNFFESPFFTCTHFARACCVLSSYWKIIVQKIRLPVPYKSLDRTRLGLSQLCSVFDQLCYSIMLHFLINYASKCINYASFMTNYSHIKIVNFIRFSLKMQCKSKEENLTSNQ